MLILFSACESTSDSKTEATEQENSTKKKIFEGSITYKITVSSPKNSPFVADFQYELGDTCLIFFKDGNCVVQSNGHPNTNIIYIASSNLEYTKMDGIDTLFVDDAATKFGELIGTKAESSDEYVLGKACKKFNINTSDRDYEFYYSPDYYLPPTTFSKYLMGYANVYYKNCQAPFLKRISKGNAFIITYEAIEIHEEQVSESLFQLPTHLPQASVASHFGT